MQLFDTAGATDTGKIRENNEDSYVICNGDVLLAAVADGIGGHAHGEIASMLACTGLAEKFKNFVFDDSITSQDMAVTLKNWIEEVNTSIFERNKAEHNYLPMGSTLCVALFTGKFAVCANVGDSRLCCLENGTLRRMTDDHVTWHGKTQFLSRAVGIGPMAKPELFIFSPELSDSYILMSDGIYKSLDDKEIADILSRHNNASDAAKNLVDRANDKGGIDNLTAVAILKRGM